MSSYNIERFLNDFARRTVHNLIAIKKQVKAGEKRLYDTTQLINSLMGLIILPVEANKKAYYFSDLELKNTSKKYYNKLERILYTCIATKRFYDDYPEDKEKAIKGNNSNRISIGSLINHIRNAVAHGGNNGLHFFPLEENEEITGIVFYDNQLAKKNNEGNQKESAERYEFCIKLNLEELFTLVTSITMLYCKYEDKNKKVKEKQAKYNSAMTAINNLLETQERRDSTKTIFDLPEGYSV